VKSPALTIARISLAGVFALAALTKTLDFGEFAVTLRRSMLLPEQFVPVVGVALILIEVSAALLLAGRYARQGALAALTLSCVFFGYSLWRWLQDISAPCSCFGVLFRLAAWQSTILCVVLAAIATWITVALSAGYAVQHLEVS